jgi:hypothetical protein
MHSRIAALALSLLVMLLLPFACQGPRDPAPADAATSTPTRWCTSSGACALP